MFIQGHATHLGNAPKNSGYWVDTRISTQYPLSASAHSMDVWRFHQASKIRNCSETIAGHFLSTVIIISCLQSVRDDSGYNWIPSVSSRTTVHKVGGTYLYLLLGMGRRPVPPPWYWAEGPYLAVPWYSRWMKGPIPTPQVWAEGLYLR